MSRSPRRHRRTLAVVPALLSVCALFLTACGDDDDGGTSLPGAGKEYDRLDAVTISGDVGSPPEVEWKGSMKAGKVESETLVEGDGAQVTDSDDVLAQLWIGNGFSKEMAFSTYEEKRAELLTVNDELPAFLGVVRDATVGSRLAVTASAEEAFGPGGNPQIGIGNKDSVLVVIDLVSEVLDEPKGEASPDPDWMPPLQMKKGVPTGFGFDGVPEPTGDLRRVQLLKGSGPRVKKGQTIAVRYLGQAWEGKKPFDGNYGDDGKGAPTTFGIGTGQVIKGWDQGLEGVPVGSRVVLEIPPDLAYGKKGSPDAGIPKNATLVFVIDILAAA